MFGGQLTGSSDFERGWALMVSTNGSIYVAGKYSIALDLDFGNDPPSFTSEIGAVGFIAKYTGAPLSANTSPTEINFVAYTNPTSGLLTIESSRNLSDARVQVLNQLGQTVNHSFRVEDQRICMEVNGKDGLYFVQLLWRDGTSSCMKVVKKN